MKRVLAVVIGLTFACGLAASELKLTHHQLESSTEQYKKYSHQVVSSGVIFNNPFSTQEVKTKAEVTAPSGTVLTVPMYYISKEDTTTQWGLNFAPREIGEYSYKIVFEYNQERVESNKFTFHSTPTEGKGFLTSDGQKGSWKYDNGERFRGVGVNIGWEDRSSQNLDLPSPKHTYEYWFQRMQDNNVNLVRTWLNAPWDLPIEWLNISNGGYEAFSGPGLHPQAISRIDDLIDNAEQNDVYLILVMDYHGALWKSKDGWGNDFWDRNPYNVANGGSAKTPQDFFTDNKAIERYQDRLRYIIARWGYSDKIAAIEYWNEIDNAVFKDGQDIDPNVVVEWHDIMSNFLKKVDPYNHIQTTSISHKTIDGLFSVSGIDLVQTHLYGVSPKETEAIIQSKTQKYNKSYAVGEAALGWEGVEHIEEYAEHMHDSMWIAMFNKTPFLPLTWWWEAYDANDKLFHFTHMASFIQNLTGEDEMFDSKLAIEQDDSIDYRSLSNDGSHYIWVKNITPEPNVLGNFTVTGTSDSQLKGQFKVSIYDTWTGNKHKLSTLQSKDNSIVVDGITIAPNRDIVVMLDPV